MVPHSDSDVYWSIGGMVLYGEQLPRSIDSKRRKMDGWAPLPTSSPPHYRETLHRCAPQGTAAARGHFRSEPRFARGLVAQMRQCSRQKSPLHATKACLAAEDHDIK